MISILLAGALLAASPAPTAASAPAAAPKSTSSKAKLEKIRRLLHVTKSDEAGANMLASLKARVPPADYDALSKLIHSDELTDQFVAIYDRHFTEADIDGLLAFYATPLGQRLLAEGPAIAQEAVEMSQKYAISKLEQYSKSKQQSAPADVPAKKP